jgi:hypothetical protein
MNRSRIARSRQGQREVTRGGGRARAVRVSRGRDDVVVEVHVHNELPRPEEPRRERAGAMYLPPHRRPRPSFSGTLFSWRDHYHPIFEKIVPVVTSKAERERRFLSRLARLTLWAAVLAALTTVGCEYFRS